MSFEVTRRLIALLRDVAGEDLRRIVYSLTPAELLALDACFELWAHRSQLPPDGERWRVWLIMAGRGFGKTRAGAEWIHAQASGKAGVRIALVGATIADARSIMVEGVSGLLNVARLRGHSLNWEPSLGRVRWANGSEARLFSGDHADGLRGPEHEYAWGAPDPGRASRGGSRRGAPSLTAHFAAVGGVLPRGNGPTGAWAGKPQCIAANTSGGWRFIPPVEGMIVYVRTTSVWAAYRLGAWEIGSVRGSSLVLGGQQVVGGRAAAVPSPTGGRSSTFKPDRRSTRFSRPCVSMG